MLENTLHTIKINGTAYPLKCTMVVLEKIQKEFGDILQYEYGIRGLNPYFDPDSGKRIKEKDAYTVPDVTKVVRSLVWMIEEGIDIAESDLEVPTEKEIMRQNDWTINDLAGYAFAEYSECFLSTASKPKRSRKGTKGSSSKATA